MRGSFRRLSVLAQPSRAIAVAFAAVIALGTVLLLLPVSAATGRHATVLEALFTATSALCVTGHVVVDTATFWSPFGQVVILALIQIGGFGVMSLATLLGLLVARRLGLRTRLTAVSETHGVGPGDVQRVLRGVGVITLVAESLVAVILTARWSMAYDEPPGHALWLGVFHSISAFNNAGFSLRADSLVQYATDPWISLPVCVAVIAGGLGFPVIMELRTGSRVESCTSSPRNTSALLVPGPGPRAYAWGRPTSISPRSTRSAAGVGDHLVDRSLHVEVALGEVVVLAVQDLAVTRAPSRRPGRRRRAAR